SMDGGENSSGGVLVFRGPLAAGALSVSDADGSLAGELAGDAAGSTLTASADLGGDGVDDLLVGAYQNDDGAENSGKVYLVSGIPGSAEPLGDSLASIVGALGNGWVGYGVAAPGDLDGDGAADVVVGSTSSSASDAKIAIFSGPFTGDRWTDEPDFAIRCDACGWNSADGVGAIGDADGDGLADWYATVSGASLTYIWSGAPVSDSFDDADARWALTGDAARYGAGFFPPERQGGDVDADGRDDFTLRSASVDGGTSYYVQSVAWLISGSVVTGVHTVDEASASFVAEDERAVAGQPEVCGDVDGDGRNDVVSVGTLGDPWSEYALVVWYGSVTGSHTPDDAPLQISGGAVGTPFAPDFAADATGDGLDDLLVTTTNGTSSPSVWLIPGLGF
ncbi:MAG: hypothetical protein ACOZNI_07865, partial [Myxococcota bacterium]